MKKQAVIIALLVGCGDVSQNEDSAYNTITDSSGRVWTKGPKARLTTYEAMVSHHREGFLQQPLETIDTEIATHGFAIDPAEVLSEDPNITVEQLANDIRGVTLIDGYEYTSEADLGQAVAILAARRVGGDVGPLTSPSPLTEEVVTKTKCCGNDGRHVTTTALYYQSILLSEVGCTAEIIASNVAIIAAHCVYDTVANAWMQVQRTSTTTSLPYYRRQTNSTGTKVTHNCYNVVVPGCWVSATSNSSVSCDYAVLDFSKTGTTACSNPAPFSAWYGFWSRSDTQIETAPETVAVGYPAYANLSGGNINGPGLTFMYTRLNSTWGANTIVNGSTMFANQPSGSNDATGVEIRNQLDAQSGDSGRPHLQFITNGFYVIGTHVGNVASGAYSIDRRMDGTIESFIIANSPL
jgi:hypothetical protein